MPKLLRFQRSGSNLLNEISSINRMFVTLLLDDEIGQKIDHIYQDNLGEPNEISMTILKKWLHGEGKKTCHLVDTCPSFE